MIIQECVRGLRNIFNARKKNSENYITDVYLNCEQAGYDMALLRGALVLNIDCGSSPFVSERYDTVGLDVFLPNLRVAKRRFDGDYMMGDDSELPFKEGKFDSTITKGMYHPNGYCEKLMDEMMRVTKKGGSIIIINDKKTMQSVQEYCRERCIGFDRLGSDIIQIIKQ
jgi:ubiquinone/menaquinone biosynthesis C-methylase UbiE